MTSVEMFLPGLVCLKSMYYLKCGLSMWKCGLLLIYLIFLMLSYKYNYFYINVYKKASIRPRLIGCYEILKYELNLGIAKSICRISL